MSLCHSQIELNLEWFLITVNASDCLANLLCESKNSSIREPAETHDDMRFTLWAPDGGYCKATSLTYGISNHFSKLHDCVFAWVSLKSKLINLKKKRNSCFLRQILSVVESQALCTELVLGDVQLSIAY